MKAQEYLKKQKEQERKMKDAWILTSQPITDKRRKILDHTLNILDNNEEDVRNLSIYSKTMSKYDNYINILDAMSNSLKNDLNIYTNNKYLNFVEKCALGFLESGKVHAACTRKTLCNEILDGYIIYINLGTYYALQLIAKAIIVENFQGDFIKFKRKGTEFIEKSTKIFFEKDPSVIKDSFWYEYPEKVQAEANASQSAFVTKVLQFIVLHELGHIVNQDFEIMENHFMCMFQENSVKIQTNQIEVNHKAEYNADDFAFDNLFGDINDDLEKWSTFYAIYYFFVWLDFIEYRQGESISNIHPKPMERANRLLNKISKITNNDFNYLKLIEELNNKLKKEHKI
ncbi:hypothetical protein QJU96_08435 [Pasteurella skyensis]|uniref:hypothetical protein n=1 Tax=Phocoenobacter skyensis TaxID=97481 RepID=UPI00278E7375|nr:hypothetical protein [Pasteurella skyensis]MDP8171313.1 hypothetical protein [Pasteurella skyensis]